MDQLQNHNFSWFYNRPDITKQPGSLKSKERKVFFSGGWDVGTDLPVAEEGRKKCLVPYKQVKGNSLSFEDMLKARSYVQI